MAEDEASEEGRLCAACNTPLPEGALECPECNEPVRSKEKEAMPSRRRRNYPFWAGLVLIIIGGPGIALGSWLHDLLKIPIWGDAFDVFGWVNKLVAAVGLICLLVGMAMMVWAVAREASEEG